MGKKRLLDFVTIGVIEKAHGIKGNVKVKPNTDYPPRFESLKTVIVERPDREMEELEVSKVLVRDDVIYLGLKGIDTRDAAQALRGAFINIKKEDVLPLEEGRFYHFEILGFEVKKTSGELLGKIEEVMDLPANAVLVVKDENREYLIPAIQDVVKKIDMERGEIMIEPMDGLLE